MREAAEAASRKDAQLPATHHVRRGSGVHTTQNGYRSRLTSIVKSTLPPCCRSADVKDACSASTMWTDVGRSAWHRG